MILGRLGRLRWYRCDACGMDYPTSVYADDRESCCPMCGECPDDESDDD